MSASGFVITAAVNAETHEAINQAAFERQYLSIVSINRSNNGAANLRVQFGIVRFVDQNRLTDATEEPTEIQVGDVVTFKLEIDGTYREMCVETIANGVARCAWWSNEPSDPKLYREAIALGALRKVKTDADPDRVLLLGANDQSCSKCGARLMFSARERGNGMCGPCGNTIAEGTPTEETLPPTANTLPWWQRHSTACGTAHRGCAPTCPKAQVERAIESATVDALEKLEDVTRKLSEATSAVITADRRANAAANRVAELEKEVELLRRSERPKLAKLAAMKDLTGFHPEGDVAIDIPYAYDEFSNVLADELHAWASQLPNRMKCRSAIIWRFTDREFSALIGADRTINGWPVAPSPTSTAPAKFAEDVKLEGVRVERDGLRAHVERLETSSARMARERDNLRTHVAEADRMLKERDEEVHTLRTAVRAITKVRDEQATRLENVLGNYRDLETRLATTTKQRDAAEITLIEVNERNDALREDLRAHQIENVKLCNQLNVCTSTRVATMPGRPHITTNGEFQSDKYPTCPAGKVPLSVKDPAAQDLLWEYAQRRRVIDPQFAEDLEFALCGAGFAWLAVAAPVVFEDMLRRLLATVHSGTPSSQAITDSNVDKAIQSIEWGTKRIDELEENERRLGSVVRTLETDRAELQRRLNEKSAVTVTLQKHETGPKFVGPPVIVGVGITGALEEMVSAIESATSETASRSQPGASGFGLLVMFTDELKRRLRARVAELRTDG